MRRIGAFSIAASLALALDLWSKQLVEARFQLHETLALAPGLAFTHVRNPGAAFSMLADADPRWRLPFFIVVMLVALGACIYMLRDTSPGDRPTRLGLGLICAGALGNGLDRIRYGEVVDFILVDLGFWPLNPWPVFNVADSAVFIGVCFLLWRAYRPYPSPDASHPA